MSHPQTLIVSAVPHRHPMLFVDRLDPETDRNHRGAVKAITGNETHREGAGDPEANGIPHALVVDALGQLAIQMLATVEASGSSVWYLAAIHAMRLGHSPEPGDELEMEVALQRSWRGTSRVSVRASVRGEMAAAGTMILSRSEPKRQSAD